jgi:hypothetical protein
VWLEVCQTAAAAEFDVFAEASWEPFGAGPEVETCN